MFQPIMPTLRLLESTLVQQQTPLQQIENAISECEQYGDPADSLAFLYSVKHKAFREDNEPEYIELFPITDEERALLNDLPF